MHPEFPAHPRLRNISLAAVALATLLTACGGGGAEAPAPSTATPAAAPLPATAGAAVTETGAAASEAAAPTASAEAVALPTERALAANPVGTSGVIYYVDNRVGSDTNDGKSSTSSGTGKGPWQSLAKAAASINPGDTLRLNCGASWNETFKPAKSGTATAPIIVAAYPAGCSTPPAIDGATYIAASAWRQYSGSIYRATLAARPLLVNNDAGTMTLAHHPNRGFNTAQPNSLYLRNAADSGTLTVNGQLVSQYLTTGSDLVLPKGATLGTGTVVRVRTNSWTVDESTISSVSGTRVNFATPTRYPLKSGWGYYFAGQLWMLDSAGEWYWDAAGASLYAWMPDSAAPKGWTRAATRSVGVILDRMSYVTLDGLTVRSVGVGVTAEYSTGIVVRNGAFQDIGGNAIDATSSSGLRVDNNAIARTDTDAISAAGSTGLYVTNNVIKQSGVTMSGSAIASLPRAAMGAIVGGTSSVVSGNSISDTAYSGINVPAGSTVSSNTVTGACTVLDDGAAIYTHGTNNGSTITGNVVQNVRGNTDGKGSNVVTQAQGIYVDEYATGVVVQDNTVTNADNGIQLHVSAGNTISGNKLYGNRLSQLWLQENTNVVSSSGDVFNNGMKANQIVPTSSAATGFTHETTISDTTHFGQYDSNIYFDRIYSRIGIEKTPNGVVEYNFPSWRAATYANGAPRNQDPNGKAASSVRYATAQVAGGNIVPNAKVATSTYGWSAWNQTAPSGVLTREACTLGYCAKYVAGGSEGLLSTPNFSVVQGQWYRITIDVLGSVDGQILNVVLRRGGGGSNGYEPLSALYAYVPIARSWKRMTFTVQATKTVNAGDPVTGDLGARLDFGSILPGQTLYVTNVEIAPVTIAEGSSRTDILVNAAAAAAAMACPTASSAPSLCSQYHRLSDNAAVTWPYTVAARNSEIIYTLDPTLVDSDGDGIADTQDACPGSAAGAVVNASGCALGQ